MKRAESLRLKEGERVYVNGYSHTRNSHGVNVDMREKVGKFIYVSKLSRGGDIESIEGWTWDIRDLDIDAPEEEVNVSLSGKKIKIDLETIL